MSVGTAPHARRTSPAAGVLIVLLRIWHLLPRVDPARCRFHPTCAEYGITALSRYGALRGGWLALRRLGRCHPWNPGGVDHVPSATASSLRPKAGK